MHRLRHRHALGTIMLTLYVVALAGCGAQSPIANSPGATPRFGVMAASQARIDVPAADRFTPFVAVVRAGASIVLHNGDKDAHTVTSVPGDPAAFDVHLDGGARQTLTLAATGTFRYFCRIHATYDPTTGQVQGISTSDHPAEPMEGVIVVV